MRRRIEIMLSLRVRPKIQAAAVEPMLRALLLLFFFFFQAEDGIRDLTVTGVQTCALPIFGVFTGPLATGLTGLALLIGLVPEARLVVGRGPWSILHITVSILGLAMLEIGRASCRERV